LDKGKFQLPEPWFQDLKNGGRVILPFRRSSCPGDGEMAEQTTQQNQQQMTAGLYLKRYLSPHKTTSINI